MLYLLNQVRNPNPKSSNNRMIFFIENNLLGIFCHILIDVLNEKSFKLLYIYKYINFS